MRGLILGALAAVLFAGGCVNRVSAEDPIPNHIPTWAFDEKFAEGEGASAQEVRRYVTYAEGGLGNEKALDDCSGSHACSSVFYFDPALVYDSAACPFAGDRDFLAVAREDWFVHLPGTSDAQHRARGTYMQTCKGVRVPVPVYEINQKNPDVAAFFAGYLRAHGDRWDYYEMDDTSTTLVDQLYGPGGGFCKDAGTANGWCTRTNELASDDDLVRAHDAFADRLRHANGTPMRFFYNGIGFGSDGPRVTLLHDPQFTGAICENCIINAGSFRPTMYSKVLDAMARVNAIDGAKFVELNTGNAESGSDDQIAQRLTTTAIAWLGFEPAHTVVWPNLEDATHNLAVWPEDAIYPTHPLQTMRDGAQDLAVAPSVWRREFGACYDDGKPIGACAAVVNGSTTPVRVSPDWFGARYAHAIVPRGGDALSGGSLDLDAPADETLAPGHASLLVR